jgi:hypothetical protein
LQQHNEFRHLPGVNCEQANYRFYVGVATVTESDIEIGTIAFFDDKPRPQALSKSEQKCMSLLTLHFFYSSNLFAE